MSRRRVVVTGLGIISPVGIGVSDAWSNILAGRSGITRITRFDTSQFPAQHRGRGQKLRCRRNTCRPRKPAATTRSSTMDSFPRWKRSRMRASKAIAGDKERVGVCMGSGIGGLPMIEDTQAAFPQGGVRKISPFFVPGSIINMIAGLVSIHYGYKGPNLATVSACSSANHSIGEAARLIEYGDADVMVAGGAESTISPLGIGGFCASRALSHAQRRPRNRQPSLGHCPRRICAGGGRRRPGAGRTRACQGARRAHLLRTHRIRNERRRAPHHGAARRR